MTLVVSSLGMTAGVYVARPASAASSTTTMTTTTTGTTALASPSGSDPAAHYFVINGTVNAASDHEILGSSAFPNYAKGAVDNYYSMAHSHVDNSPFAEGTASPADTGPIGQTAAAGNAQQPQYADARWPGNSGKATYGTQGGPYAVADASEYKATAESSEATSGLSGTSPSTQMAAPKGFNGRLRQALATWKAKWEGRLGLKTPAGAVTTPTPSVTTPTATVTTPAGTVTTPTVTVGGLPTTPTVSVPSPPVPPVAPGTATPSRSTSSASTASGDGASLLESSTLATLDPKTGALVTSGESRLGRVSLGGGQIVLEGIHVSATITNDGTPTEKVAVFVGAATVGGVPVTIDQDGVHVAGQAQSLPYQQASDALNNALKQAGIQLFVVAPEIARGKDTGNTCTNSSGDTGKTTTTNTSGQTGTTTNSSGPPGVPTTTNSNGDTANTCTNSSGQTGSSTCPTSSKGQKGTSTTTSSSGETGTATSSTDSSEEKVTATGLHVVFTQPVDQPGVPAQYVQHILGEVSVDSLATPAGPLPNLNLSNLSRCGLSGGHSGRTKTSGRASKGGGGSLAGASTSSSSPSASGSTSSGPTSSSLTGGASQPASTSTGNAGQTQTSPTGLAAALRKPLWLLLAYLVWQALMIATGWSLWSWHRGGAS